MFFPIFISLLLLVLVVFTGYRSFAARTAQMRFDATIYMVVCIASLVVLLVMFGGH